jgi:hypothetical protein
MQGRRLKDVTDEDLLPDNVQPGNYWKDLIMDIWWVCLPDGTIRSLVDHQVIEHEDKTITVIPFIQLGRSWCGYLEHGNWREITET